VTELDTVDRALLEGIQATFPLVPRPYAALGEPLGLDQDRVLARLRRLREAGLIRQIGAIFDTRRLGYESTLVAFHVKDSALEEVAARVSAHPGVSHNYARDHHYNLWFTLAVPPGQSLAGEIRRLADEADVADWLNLPSLRVYKLRTHFKMGGNGEGPGPGAPRRSRQPGRDLAPDDIPFVRTLQRDLPLVPRPFAAGAERLGLDEEALLARALELQEAGIMRRFGAVLRHRRVGYRANGMACWAVPESQIDAAGRLAAGYAQVSHCYHRPAYRPRWPYTLFTMVHGRTEAQVEAIVAQLGEEIGIEDYQVLYSTREFKKERVKYFEP
jgi:DNA-binding Lrp family transcriptional regulator